MNIHILEQKQNPFEEDVLYTPDLVTEHHTVVAKVYPAVKFILGEPQYYMIADEQIGRYEERIQSRGKTAMYSALGGKEEVEKGLRKIFDQYIGKEETK